MILKKVFLKYKSNNEFPKSKSLLKLLLFFVFLLKNRYKCDMIGNNKVKIEKGEDKCRQKSLSL